MLEMFVIWKNDVILTISDAAIDDFDSLQFILI